MKVEVLVLESVRSETSVLRSLQKRGMMVSHGLYESSMSAWFPRCGSQFCIVTGGHLPLRHCQVTDRHRLSRILLTFVDID